jgi:hypothetical protein
LCGKRVSSALITLVEAEIERRDNIRVARPHPARA